MNWSLTYRLLLLINDAVPFTLKSPPTVKLFVILAAANVALVPIVKLSNLAVGDTISPAIAAGATTDGVPIAK